MSEVTRQPRPVCNSCGTGRVQKDVDCDAQRVKIGWQAQFALLSAIWGLGFMFIKVGDEALARHQAGALLLGERVGVAVSQGRLNALRPRLLRAR